MPLSGPVHRISDGGHLTDPGVHFALVHGLTPATVQMSFLLPWSNFEKRVSRCTAPGNPPCRGNFSPCEQKSCPGAGIVLLMLIINVLNKFHNEKFQKAPEIRKNVQNSFSVTICIKTDRIQMNS